MPSARERRTDRERWSWVLTSERALASGHRCPLPRDHLGYDAESQTNRSPPGPGAYPVRSSSEGIDAPGAGTGPHPGASASDVEPHLVPRRRASMPPSKGPRDTRHPSPPGLSSSRSCEEGIDAPSSSNPFALEMAPGRQPDRTCRSTMPSPPSVKGIDALFEGIATLTPCRQPGTETTRSSTARCPPRSPE